MTQLTSTAWNEPSQICDLLARFPYMFPLKGTDGRRAYIFFRGWMPTVALMCAQIDAVLGEDKRDFEWTRIREKFGAPSIAYQMRGHARHVIHAHRPTEVRRIPCAPSGSFEPSAIAIQETVLLTEVALRGACIVCAAPSTITNVGGPWASLCAEHQKLSFLTSLGDKAGALWSAAELRLS